MKNKNAQTIEDSFENIILSSQRKPNLIETDEGSEFVNKFFTNLLKYNNIKRNYRSTSLGAAFAESIDRSIRGLLKRPVFERGRANWIGVLPTITKQYINGKHSCTKLIPIQASSKKNEGYVYQNLLNKRKTNKTKFPVNDLVRSAELKRTFSKGDTTDWSYKVYKVTEVIDGTIPSYKSNQLPENYNGALLKQTKLTLKENKDVMKALNSN